MDNTDERLNTLPFPPPEMLLALVNPVEGKEEEFREWYWVEHIPEVLALPGFRAAYRYGATPQEEAATSHRYATMYEVDVPAYEALRLLFGSKLGTSDAIDLSSMIMLPLTAEGEPILPPAVG